MTRSNALLSGCVLALILLLVGCGGSGGTRSPAVSGGAPLDSTTSGSRTGEQGVTSPLPTGAALTLDALNDPNSPLAKRIIYFDFDSSQVRQEDLDIVALHGQFLANNPEQRVRLEGHSDERGSREYNLGLGERRGQAVSQLLKLEGINPGQMELISYGEELPAAFGHDEESWQLNRRVEIVYLEQ